MNKYISEMIGTFFLVFMGTAAVVIGGAGDGTALGNMLIGLSFGIGLMAAAYAVGPVSGAHLNPAVTLGIYCAGRMRGSDVLPYWLFQIAGGILASFLLWCLVYGGGVGEREIVDFGANSWNPEVYTIFAILITEMIATLVFVLVITGVTSQKDGTNVAGVIIGLTLVALHVAFIPVSGSSLNPARSIGPALFSGWEAVDNLWPYLFAPLVGGAIAGFIARQVFSHKG